MLRGLSHGGSTHSVYASSRSVESSADREVSLLFAATPRHLGANTKRLEKDKTHRRTIGKW